ncbi:inositol hexakisphosphate kinase 1-like [Saccostrea echinata]|uniref:inositol hexakisphosphate kinase 1-like n=1 Tax=Saccostrea echinata TaxID=191078 RepID=UPI002A82FBAA|nr:inositol hexakisphosphate kinase 1-like [Saccostrea echinata]
MFLFDDQTVCKPIDVREFNFYFIFHTTSTIHSRIRSTGNMGEWYESVQLQPFVHQVSGHNGLFRFDDQTVCKPLDVREYNFYITIPHNLKQFTAEFRETIEGEVCEDSEGHVTILYHRPLLKSPMREDLTRQNQETFAGKEGQHSLQLLMNGKVEMNTQTDQAANAPDSVYDLRPETLNPWIPRCHKKMLSGLRKTNQSSDLHSKFILLENVAAKFCHPSILDLKMGTRQHGDHVSPEKKEKAMKMCQNTTSSSLGVRVGGMQVYQENSDKYTCVNKKYCQGLGVDGFIKTLHQFLHNGYELRKDLLDPIIGKLQDLHRQVLSLDTYRFYASSLLILYDQRSEEDGPKKDLRQDKVCSHSSLVDVRMIDFGHCTKSGFLDDATAHKGPDEGYLLGLTNLIKVFTDMK